MAPFLSRLALALGGFVSGDIAIIDAWPTWSDGAPAPRRPQAEDGHDGGHDERAADGTSRDGGTSRFREIHPHVLDVAPQPVDDAAAAAVALQNTVAVLRRGVAAVLIHLGGYARAWTPPAPVILTDGVVLMAPARRTQRATVGAIIEHIPPPKRLGAILIG